MTKIYAFFIALLCMQSVAYAVISGEPCIINSTNGTEQCDSGLYCATTPAVPGPQGECTQCPNTHPNSTMGQNNQRSDCYKTCGNNPDFANGTWTPNHPTANYDNNCQYTYTDNITCNNTSNKCSGYHLSDEKCVSNYATCNNGSHSGFQTYDSDTSSWSDCFITTCASGYHLENTENMCEQPHGTCVSNTNSCASELTCDYGYITGEINWQNGAYDYSNCHCKGDANLNYGTGTKRCTWNGTTWADCQITLDTCIEGYWQGESENPTDCIKVSAGYFSDVDSLDRTKCLAGSTSNAGSTSITECYMTGNTTKICDSNSNCFTLPGTNKIYYHNGQ